MRVGSGAGVVQKQQQQQGGCCAGGGCCEAPTEVKSQREMAEARKVEEACKAKEADRGLGRERERERERDREDEEEEEAEAEDVDVMLKQREDLLSSMFEEGFIDEQYSQLQMLQDESNPDFVEEVVTLFFTDSERLLENLTDCLKTNSINYKVVDGHVHQFKGSSSSIGAQRVKQVCITFRQCCDNKDKEGWRNELWLLVALFLSWKSTDFGVVIKSVQWGSKGRTLCIFPSCVIKSAVPRSSSRISKCLYSRFSTLVGFSVQLKMLSLIQDCNLSPVLSMRCVHGFFRSPLLQHLLFGQDMKYPRPVAWSRKSGYGCSCCAKLLIQHMKWTAVSDEYSNVDHQSIC